MAYIVSVWLHILAACVWIGSSVFLVLGVLPYFRTRASDLLLDFMEWSAPRLRLVGWGSLGVLITTGLFNLHVRGYTLAQALDGTLWQGPFGRTIAEKLVVVVILTALTAYHDLYWGPRTLALRRAAPASPAARRARMMTIRLGQVSLLLSLTVVLLAVMLVRGRM